MKVVHKVLIGAVVFLLITNTLLLGFVWKNRPGHRDHFRKDRREVSGRFLLDKLGLSEDQKPVFRKETRIHRQKMTRLERALKESKHARNKAIIQRDKIAELQHSESIIEIHRELEAESQRFVAFLSSLCDENQKEVLISVLQGPKPKARPSRGH